MVRSTLTLYVLIISTTLTLGWQNSLAQEGGWRQNTQLLPPYCAYRVTPEGKANTRRMYPSLKKIWLHIHHYCSGMYAEIEVKKTQNQRKKTRLLELMTSEMQYVSRHCKVGCVLYPELHSRWGWALNEEGDVSEAIQHYRLAIKAKPDYATAYALLSDLHAEINQPDEARKVLEDGLKVRPKSRLLQKRLHKLDSTE